MWVGQFAIYQLELALNKIRRARDQAHAFEIASDTLAKHQARMDAISARKAEIEAAALAPVITLHLTSNQLVSRIDMTINGAAHSATFHGERHMSRARTLALEVKAALKVDTAAAVALLAA